MIDLSQDEKAASPAAFRWRTTFAHVGIAIAVVAGYTVIWSLYFWPVLTSEHYLCYGDSHNIDIPSFFSPFELWSPGIYSGFPVAAEPNFMNFYPLRFLSMVPHGWNIFLVSAYIIAGALMHGFAYRLTRSHIAATASGLGFSASASLANHIPHTFIIHSMAWLPLLIWSVDELRERFSRRWLAIGALALGMMTLAGNSQVMVYSVYLASFYFLATLPRVGGWRRADGFGWRAKLTYTGAFSALLAIGFALAAIQLLPTYELSKLSSRAESSFKLYTSWNLAPSEFALMYFPLIYGHDLSVEFAGGIGLASVLLATVGVAMFLKRPAARYWTIAAVVTFLLALGDNTPLARLFFALPLAGRFRVISRHLLPFSFAISVLIGLGVDAIVRGVARKRVALTIAALHAAVMACLAALFWGGADPSWMPTRIDHPRPAELFPWQLEVDLQLILGAVIIAAFIALALRPRSKLAAVGLLLTLIASLYSTHRFNGKETLPQAKTVMCLVPASGLSRASGYEEPAAFREYSEELRSSHTRVLIAEGYGNTVIWPNVTHLWNIPSVSGNSSLMLDRYSRMLRMGRPGDVGPELFTSDHRALELLATRFLIKRAESIEGTVERDGFTLGRERRHALIRGGRKQRFMADVPIAADHIVIASATGNTAQIPQGTAFASLHVLTAKGDGPVLPIRLGEHTADHAARRPSVADRMRHQMPPLFSDPKDIGTADYFAEFELDDPVDVVGVEITTKSEDDREWIRLAAISVGTREHSEPIQIARFALDGWEKVGTLTDENRAFVFDIFRNENPHPRAWFVDEVRVLPANEVLATIERGRFHDGSMFDPHRTALVEAPVTSLAAEPLTTSSTEPAAGITIAADSSDTIQLRVSHDRPQLLVLSDIDYPGWIATIDDRVVPIEHTDYLLRGVSVPAGEHDVAFRYRPGWFTNGCTLSGLAAAIVLVLLSGMKLTGRRTQQSDSAA